MAEGGGPVINGEFRVLDPNERSDAPVEHVNVSGATLDQGVSSQEGGSRVVGQNKGWLAKLLDRFGGESQKATRAESAIREADDVIARIDRKVRHQEEKVGIEFSQRETPEERDVAIEEELAKLKKKGV